MTASLASTSRVPVAALRDRSADRVTEPVPAAMGPTSTSAAPALLAHRSKVDAVWFPVTRARRSSTATPTSNARPVTRRVLRAAELPPTSALPVTSLLLLPRHWM